MTHTDAIRAVDTFHKLRTKPSGWIFSAIGLGAIVALAWLAPKLYAWGERLERIDERSSRTEIAVTRIETALINRGVMADRRPRTDLDDDAQARVAAVQTFRLLDDASADDGVVGPGVPRRVHPAAASPAAADRVR